MDIAFPNKNEEEFLRKKKDLKFVYPYRKKFASHYNYGFISERKMPPFSVYKSTGNDRWVFENGMDVIFGLELSPQRDFIYARHSGLNQVLAKLAHDNGITIGFSLADFLKAKNKAAVFGRMQQNWMLCKKYKVKVLVASFATTPEELADEITLKAFERLLDKRKLF